MTTRDDIVRVLLQAGTPLLAAEIATALGSDLRECDALLWQDPEQFVWQPGHRWMLASTKSHSRRALPTDVPDARSDNAISAGAPRQLQAITLSSGVVIAVNRRPLDSDAFFTVRSAGNTITLTLNSTHELFIDMPTPFEDNEDDSPYKRLCELLLSAWVLYEDSLPGGSVKRAAEDARLLWGRRAIEMLRETDG
ncbi:hypothetical protein MOKP104_43200 [Mycobacterium avium subsp. hominissuis]